MRKLVLALVLALSLGLQGCENNLVRLNGVWKSDVQTSLLRTDIKLDAGGLAHALGQGLMDNVLLTFDSAKKTMRLTVGADITTSSFDVLEDRENRIVLVTDARWTIEFLDDNTILLTGNRNLPDLGFKRVQ